VNDVRESPALAVMRRLWEAGAVISYHDPLLPEVVIGGQRHTDLIPMPPGTPVADLPRLYSEPLSGDVLSSSDCVVVLTAHPDIDYDEVVASAPLVFDAVGVTRARRVPNVVLL
jgi:UDP-N-acetyl-D-glucosamine dehydrogenase